MPIIPPTSDPESQQHCVVTSSPLNKSNALTVSINQLTEIIKQQEFELMNIKPLSNNICGGESCSSVTSSNQVAIVKHTNSLHEHIEFRFLQDKSKIIQVSIDKYETTVKNLV